MSIKSSGYYDMEAVILIGTPEAGVFILRSDQKPLQAKPFLPPRAPIVEIAFNGNTIAIATSDHTVRYYTLQVTKYSNFHRKQLIILSIVINNIQGQELRKIVVDTFILAIAWIQSLNQELCLLAVSLANGLIHFYRQGILLDQLNFKTSIVSMTFGRYGREDGALVMVSKG